MEIDKDKLNKTIKTFTEKAGETARDVEGKASQVGQKVSRDAIKIIDKNGNGKIDLEDFTIRAIKEPKGESES